MNFPDARDQLITVARSAYRRGWVPATSGNFSARIADGDIAITVSGNDKGTLSEYGIMRLNADGSPQDNLRPSAEAALHLQLYARDNNINAVFHTHSVGAVIASQSVSDVLRFQNLEILKAFEGIETHAVAIDVPIFENSQDITKLADKVERHMSRNEQGVAYLIAGHGLYTWGGDIDDAMRHLETLEYLFDYDRISRTEKGGSKLP